MRVLHAIHDFLPRHRAGSEIYCLQLCQALQARGTQVHVLCAEYDLARPHGSLAWRVVDGIGVTEVVNNWAFTDLAESYGSSALEHRLGQVLDIVQPDVLHVHNLLNLSFALPALAGPRGVPVVATLHDYTLVCASGGQRVHLAEEHVCTTIEPERCARCFSQHPLQAQLAFGRTLRGPARGPIGRTAAALHRRLPLIARRAAGAMVRHSGPAIDAAAIEARLARARDVFADVALFVAPSRSLGNEYLQLGLPPHKLRVADYGFPPLPAPSPRGERAPGPLRVGFLGTLVWHKGVHVLLDAVGRLPAGSVEVTLYGDLSVAPDYVVQLQRDASGLPVRFAGSVPHEQVGAALAELDVLVVPSLWMENSPLVIHEAFQAGLPVVGSRRGGTGELIAEGTSGLLYDATATDLARCLQRLTTEPELLARLAAGVPTVKELAVEAAEWEALYAEVRAAAPAQPLSRQDAIR
jgi:glycosyltransferase involved in cell wall biosynthesis